MKISGKSDVLYDKAVVGANLPSKAGGKEHDRALSLRREVWLRGAFTEKSKVRIYAYRLTCF